MHRTAPHRTAPHRTAPLSLGRFLAVVSVLSAAACTASSPSSEDGDAGATSASLVSLRPTGGAKPSDWAGGGSERDPESTYSADYVPPSRLIEHLVRGEVRVAPNVPRQRFRIDDEASGPIMASVDISSVFPLDLDTIRASREDATLRDEANGRVLEHPYVQALKASGVDVLWVEGLFARLNVSGDADVIRRLSDEHQMSVSRFDDVEMVEFTNGEVFRLATGSHEYRDAGLLGQSGSRRGGRIRLGIVESTNPFDRRHPGFNTAAGTTRVMRLATCNGSGCTTVPVGTNGHGTAVASIAAGSVLDGQGTPLPTECSFGANVCSHGLTQALIYGYSVTGTFSTPWIAAYYDYVDIINVSTGFSVWDCSTPELVALQGGNDRDIARALIALGVTIVAATGNVTQTGCLAFPAIMPAVLAVGSVRWALQPGGSIPYWNAPWEPTAIAGPLPVRARDGFLSSTAGVDIATEGYVQNHYVVPNGYASGGGTSYASPRISAFAGMIQQLYPTLEPGRIMALIAAFGDASDGTTTGLRNTSVDPRVGFGRAFVHRFVSPDVTAPFGWGAQRHTLHAGQLIRYSVWGAGAEAPGITEWKWSVVNADEDETAASHFLAYVTNQCAGQPETLVAIAEPGEFRRRVRLPGTSVSGRCLFMNLYGIYVPPEGVVLYTADYFHGGSSDEH